MDPASDWTTGPAKWVVVALLGGAAVFALGYSVGRGTTVWRGETGLTSAPAPVPLFSQPAGIEPPDSPTHEALLSPGGPVSTTAAQHQLPSIAAKINVNSATQAELELLPDVGPALAARIIEERGKGGRFTRVEDLGRVRGIGPKTIERLRSHVSVE